MLIDSDEHRRRVIRAVEQYEQRRKGIKDQEPENNEPEGQLGLFEANVRAGQ